MRRLLTMVLIGLLLQVNFVLAQVSLSYQAQEALKRQTSNMNEVENELSQQLKEVNAPSNPAIIRKSVVLPHPEGPRSVKNSLSSISRVTSLSAVKLPKSFRTS